MHSSDLLLYFSPQLDTNDFEIGTKRNTDFVFVSGVAYTSEFPRALIDYNRCQEGTK